MTDIINIPVESEDLKEFQKATGMTLADCIKILINSVKYGGKSEFEKVIDDMNHGRNITQYNYLR